MSDSASTPPLQRQAGRGKRQRRLTNYLLDKSLQLRYVGLVTALSAALSVTLGYMVYAQEHAASRSIIRTLDTLDYSPELKAEVRANLATDDSNLVVTMGLVAVGIVIVLSLYLLVMTHKVAGPLYKVSKYFDEMAVGRMSEVRPLRKGDQLQDFYAKFKEMHDAVRARQQATVRALGQLLDACDAAGVEAAGAVGHKLAEARSYRSKRLDQLA